MKLLLLAICILCVSGAPDAQTVVWEPSTGHTQIALWPVKWPGAPAGMARESLGTETKSLVAGKPWLYISNVSQPTLTVYSPAANNTGAAVLVFPGGGYQILAIDLEGTEVCDWLVSRGITCILLKYRVPNSGPHWDERCQCQLYPKVPMALQDAQRALGLVRLHAAEWHIDPHKIGVFGTSAGGHLVAAISTRYAKRVYTPVDAADRESCRPDFGIVLYPGHLSLDPNPHALNPEIRVTRDTPPTFILQAEDDPVDRVENSLVYYAALQKAGAPAELHLYAHGGHAFGLRPTEQPITRWPALVEAWLHTIGIL
jgi:acetyl esterase/lipase